MGVNGGVKGRKGVFSHLTVGKWKVQKCGLKRVEKVEIVQSRIGNSTAPHRRGGMSSNVVTIREKKPRVAEPKSHYTRCGTPEVACRIVPAHCQLP